MHGVGSVCNESNFACSLGWREDALRVICTFGFEDTNFGLSFLEFLVIAGYAARIDLVKLLKDH